MSDLAGESSGTPGGEPMTHSALAVRHKDAEGAYGDQSLDNAQPSKVPEEQDVDNEHTPQTQAEAPKSQDTQQELTDALGEDASHADGSGKDGSVKAGSDNQGPNGEPTAATQIDVGQPKKKKKKRSKKAGKSRRHITGFEEYYADSPMTPEEAALEKNSIYSHRMEECLQRYRAKRRLNSELTNMFNKYLFLGGIDSSPRQFTGMNRDQEAMEEADTEQIRQMTAVDFIHGHGGRFYGGPDDENWEVDFESIAKGFLSQTISSLYMYDLIAIKKAADLVKNFLNYVLQHDVCPEYHSDIMAARRICDIAPTEMRHTHELYHLLPGDFNRAAGTLFCDGRVRDLDSDDASFAAWCRFRLTVFLWCPDGGVHAKLRAVNDTPAAIRVVGTPESQAYEVVGVQRPHQGDVERVAESLAQLGQTANVKPAGRVRVVPTVLEHGWGNLPRADEIRAARRDKQQQQQQVEAEQQHKDKNKGAKKEEEKEEDGDGKEGVWLILEDELLARVEVGMRMELTVVALDVGVRFVRAVHDVRVSFDTLLPQHLMAGFKDPVPNERPAPSVRDPDPPAGDGEDGEDDGEGADNAADDFDDGDDGGYNGGDDDGEGEEGEDKEL
ncbi:Argonaute siRNA chaperone complex subunit Arb1-domain-containing protein [Xylariaceae sp. FL0804]|nr:Argonaute siRNA chaperone complex subunit Arb1-domain-containing protein [Xylariaceae sp. FL0804]